MAICLLVRRKPQTNTKIYYIRRPEDETADDKLSWLGPRQIADLQFTDVNPSETGDWIQHGDDQFKTLIPIAPRGRDARFRGSIFQATSAGVLTGRDDWIVGRDKILTIKKAAEFAELYNSLGLKKAFESQAIKWSRNLKRDATRGRLIHQVDENAVEHAYRPFTTLNLIRHPVLVDELGGADTFYPECESNPAIVINFGPRLPFASLAASNLPSYSFFVADPAHYLGRYQWNKSGERSDNITEWAVKQFVAHYGKKARVTKDAIFAYCYAVLNDPLYREKYALNLKREFPRMPFYDDFGKWAGWGQQLLDLHIGYEKAKPFKFTRIDTLNPKRAKGSHPKPKLKSDPEKGLVIVDEDTQLTGIPSEAWTYRLGNRSAIDWVLDQHKEKTLRDPTVRVKFNTYRLADYKEAMIKLLARVITVSLETVKITEAMRALDRDGGSNE